MAHRPIHDIEHKWQEVWASEGTYQARSEAQGSGQKYYGLIEFPFPSGEGLHVGHPRSYTAIDVMTRKRRMQGQNVLFPIGFDAFGLPTENFAIKHGVKPEEATKKNIANFTRQLQSLGLGFDWSRVVDTTDPKYYKWTQWQFLQFFHAWYDETEKRARPIAELPIPQDIVTRGDEAVRAYRDQHRMAYKATTTINWCPRCKIGLANEEAQGGVCERCGNPVEPREKAQWMIRITKYADRLIDDLATVDYLDKIKAQQIHWIGKSEGAYVDFAVQGTSDKITVFTTRPDTLFGVTYVVVAPEHPLLAAWMRDGRVQNADVVAAYQETVARRAEEDRVAEGKEKTGVAIEGVLAVHPVTGESVPVWTSDYVLGTYGTGAVMAVPAHDTRDFAFANTFGLPLRWVVRATDGGVMSNETPFEEAGIAMNSDFLNDLPTWKAKDDMISWLVENKKGEKATTYKLRDWVFSRQRYWGEPIPIIHCAACGYVPVPDAALPVVLPEVEAYQPTDTGESPLANIRAWVEVSCPTCGGPAERETDTMPNWAGSSWYFLRYCDPHNDTAFASPEALTYWMPVDLYNGGMEHTTLHLLYSRFWYKFLWDMGHIPASCGSEPYAKRRSHGLILAEGGEKMSKSKGNVVNPDEVVAQYGADVFRVYEMFMGPFDQAVPWDTNGIEGVKRFLEKVWSVLSSDATHSDALETVYHQTLKKLTDGIELMQFNTCVSQLMILTNAYQDAQGVPVSHREGYVQMLAPFAPHLAEELWRGVLGKTTSVHGCGAGWPVYDPAKTIAATFELVIQVNGKVRDKVVAASDVSEEEAIRLALDSATIQKYLEGRNPVQTRYVKGRLVNIVV